MRKCKLLIDPSSLQLISLIKCRAFLFLWWRLFLHPAGGRLWPEQDEWRGGGWWPDSALLLLHLRLWLLHGTWGLGRFKLHGPGRHLLSWGHVLGRPGEDHLRRRGDHAGTTGYEATGESVSQSVCKSHHGCIGMIGTNQPFWQKRKLWLLLTSQSQIVNKAFTKFRNTSIFLDSPQIFCYLKNVPLNVFLEHVVS